MISTIIIGPHSCILVYILQSYNRGLHIQIVHNNITHYDIHQSGADRHKIVLKQNG